MATYADSSFLVSLYTPDANSARALEEFKVAERPFLLTPFGEFEFANALELRVFRRELDTREADSYLRAFETDISTDLFRRAPMPPETYERALQLARRHTRRG